MGYPYFDPVARRYAVAYTRPETLSIAPGTLAALDSAGAGARPRWTVRTRYRGALAAPIYRDRPFWVVMLLAPLPAMVLLVKRRPRRRRRARSWARTLRALSRDGARGDDARVVRRVFLSALGERLRRPSASLAEPSELAHAARRAGTSEATASECAELLAQLNDAAFSGTTVTLAGAATRAYTVYRAVDVEARTYRVPGRLALVLLAVGGAAAARAAVPDAAATQFARGVESYNRGHYALAARDFAAVAALAPRAPDAWANYGTAAFAAGDTAHAVVGWQRALRLEPLAFDVRERLDLLAPTAGLGIGAVLPVPPLPLALLAASLWVAAWAILAWPPRRGRSGRLAVALASAVAALVLGEAVAFLDARLAARDLVVVAHDTPLRLLPALGADRGAVVRIGEAARVLEREGPWVHVVAEGERDGWIEAATVLPLARD
jgi:tetratricopeptide (TPR) repeat protein